MVDRENLEKIYELLKNDLLSRIGIENDFLRSILSYRLLIERIGEKKNNSWWNSMILDDFGRESLKEVLDKSILKSQLKLAQKVGRKAEEDILSSVFDRNQDYISLFYLRPYDNGRDLGRGQLTPRKVDVRKDQQD